jgi:hypothetical protein
MSAVVTVRAQPAGSEAELRGWFDREVQPFLAAQAASVERLGKYGLYPLPVIILSALGFVLLTMFEKLWPALACLSTLLSSLTVYSVRGPLFQAGGAAFRAVFKQRVVARIVAEVLPGATYDPDLALAHSVLHASGLVDGAVTYRGDDLVRGTIGRTPFALGDVNAGISQRGNLRSAFHGLLFHAEFNRWLAGRTVVLPAGQTPQAGPLNRGLAPVALESPEFAGAFSVYASDPIEARYVLTPSTMERLVRLGRTTGRPLYAAFDRRRVFVAIDNGKGAFEALAFGGEKAWDEVRGFAALFDTARAVVEELELNTRIWTKGFAPEAEARAASVSEPSAWTRVAALGAWAFQDRPNLPFKVNDPPAPPGGATIDRRTGGGFSASFKATWGPPFVILAVLLAAVLAGTDPTWWAARPQLERLGQLALIVRQWSGPLTLVGLTLLLCAGYRMGTRVRSLETTEGRLRVGGLGSTQAFAREQVLRVFAAEDLVMAQIQGSWIPVLLSPRLGGHGAALWLAAEVESALNGGRR